MGVPGMLKVLLSDIMKISHRIKQNKAALYLSATYPQVSSNI